MKTVGKIGWVLLSFVIICIGVDLVADKMQLRNDLIRLHVVANSDSEADQAIKLQVRDAVTAQLEPIMSELNSKEQAYTYIESNLKLIEERANQKLAELGVEQSVSVSLTQEEFDIRHYDTFSLPSGVYDALRVEIGEASGQNWWCVVFPTLCIPAASSDFQDTAVSSGFDDTLTNTLSRDSRYEIRFFLLDFLGRIENLFFKD